MDMSAAALPPRSGIASKADQAHPLFPLYQQHRSSCSRNMIDARDFRDWLYQHDASARRNEYAKHEQYPAFLAWCRETQSGARSCCPTKDNPNGLCFPENFIFWMEGGRW